MTKLRFVLSLLVLPLLISPVFAQEKAQDIRTVEVFQNVSGSTLSSGAAVVFDLTDTALVTGSSAGAKTTLGFAVDTTTTADSAMFAGILLDYSCEDDRICRFVTEGPALAQFACSTDNAEPTVAGAGVGTSSVAGMLGSGTNAGVLLSEDISTPQVTADGCLKWVWVEPDRE